MVSPTELILMYQAVSMLQSTLSFAYSGCLRADQSQYASLVNTLDVLLFSWKLWEDLEEQDCSLSTCSAEAGLYNTVVFLFKIVLSLSRQTAHHNGSLVPNSLP